MSGVRELLETIHEGLKSFDSNENVRYSVNQICYLVQRSDIDKFITSETIAGLVTLCFDRRLLDLDPARPSKGKMNNSICFKILNALESKLVEIDSDQSLRKNLIKEVEKMGDYVVGEFICHCSLIDDGQLIRQIKHFFKSLNFPEFLHKALTASIGISLSIQSPVLNFIQNVLELATLLDPEQTVKLIKEDLF